MKTVILVNKDFMTVKVFSDLKSLCDEYINISETGIISFPILNNYTLTFSYNIDGWTKEEIIRDLIRNGNIKTVFKSNGFRIYEEI